MPFSPGGIIPRDLEARQWDRLTRGIQADDKVKTFTPSWSGFSSDPAGDLSYYDFGTIVAIWNDAGGPMTGTSDDDGLSIDNLPTILRPSSTVVDSCLILITDGDTIDCLSRYTVTTAGVLSFELFGVVGSYIQAAGATIPATGVKGLPVGWFITYAK